MLVPELAAQQAAGIIGDPAQPLLHGLGILLGPRIGVIRLRLALLLLTFARLLLPLLLAFLLPGILALFAFLALRVLGSFPVLLFGRLALLGIALLALLLLLLLLAFLLSH
jgi:hypothetical protein